MPELPEVQCAVNFLHERVSGSLISHVEILWHRSVHSPDVVTFRQLIEKQRIVRVTRRAKFIKIHLSSGHYLYIHLRMSGLLDVIDCSWPREKHDRIIFTLDSGKDLRFNDVRKFGKAYLVSDEGSFEKNLGPEPLQLDEKELYPILKQSRRTVKATLLDQHLIAGLGNIYVDESLWVSRIHPLTKASSISEKKSIALARNIRAVLEEAISLEGTDNGDAVVIGGGYMPRVYGRDTLPCQICKSAIKKIIVSQRGTHFCSRCQRL